MTAKTRVPTPPSRAHGRAGAARLARLLRPAARSAGAWVSTQARVRTAGGLVRPDLLVAAGELPVDGIVDGPPLLVVELTPAGLLRWVDVPGAVGWGVAAQGAVMLQSGAVAPVGQRLTVPGAPWLTLAPAQLLDVAG